MSEAILGVATDKGETLDERASAAALNAGTEMQRTMTARSQCIGGAEGKGVWGSD
jgi:hypothetical protein